MNYCQLFILLILFNICIVAVSGLCVWLPPLLAKMVLSFWKFLYLIALFRSNRHLMRPDDFLSWTMQRKRNTVDPRALKWIPATSPSEWRGEPFTMLHLWTWLSWRRKSKLPKEHCVNQQAVMGSFPCFSPQRGAWFDSVSSVCAAIQRTAAVPVPHQILRFQVWGSNPSQGNFFVMWLQWQLILINRWNFWKIFSIDWPLQKVERRKKSENIALTGVWTPDLDTWNWNCHSMLTCSTRSTRSQPRCGGKQGKRPMIACCLTQCSNGSLLGSLLFPRQDNHVQRCYAQLLCNIIVYL